MKKKNDANAFVAVTLDPEPQLTMGEVVEAFKDLEIGEYEVTYTWDGVDGEEFVEKFCVAKPPAELKCPVPAKAQINNEAVLKCGGAKGI